MSRDVCPWNVGFANALPEGSPYAARGALGTRDARTLVRELSGMSQPEFSAAFEGSPTKHVLRLAQDRLRGAGSRATRRSR